MESPFRTASPVAKIDSPPEEVKVSERGQLMITYAPGDKTFGGHVVADIVDGTMAEPILHLIAPSFSLTREQWGTIKAYGDRAWAEFDKAVRQRKERA